MPHLQTDIIFRENDFRNVQEIALKEAGISLPDSKESLVFSRVSRRIRTCGFKSFSEYLYFVSTPNGAEELTELICALTTNVTQFYRENSHFTHLNNEVLPRLALKARRGEKVRLWSSACSSGEEAWSMGVQIINAIPEAPHLNLRILGTDINYVMVQQARKGIYPLEGLLSIPANLRAKAVEQISPEEGRFTQDVRKIMTFNTLNLNKGWPFDGVFDVIFCRNVVIYFDQETRNRLWRRLAERLTQGGFLYVGHSERVESPETLGLETVAPTIYRKA